MGLAGIGWLLTALVTGAPAELSSESPAESATPTAPAKPTRSPSSPPPAPRLDLADALPELADDERERAGLGLRRQNDGSYLYVDPYRRFTATFNPDGTVNFADRWRRPDRGKSQRGRFGGPPTGLFTPNGMSVTGPAEWVMALQGIDRNARVKAELLAQTREVRIALAIAFTRERLAERLAALEGELGEIWADTRIPPEARRKLLFDRWDECDEAFDLAAEGIPEEALSAIDRARLDTAERARRRIEAFVRSTLPHGSTAAYTTGELRSLNARRRSRQPFAPYQP